MELRCGKPGGNKKPEPLHYGALAPDVGGYFLVDGLCLLFERAVQIILILMRLYPMSQARGF